MPATHPAVVGVSANANGNNSHSPTSGYALTRVFLSWLINDNETLTAGAENLFDKDYIDHSTGFNRVIGSHVPRGSRLFGPGRNLFGRIQYRW